MVSKMVWTIALLLASGQVVAGEKEKSPCTTVAPQKPEESGPVHCDSFDCSNPCEVGGPWDPKEHQEKIECPKKDRLLKEVVL
jgi:hypothetical protein